MRRDEPRTTRGPRRVRPQIEGLEGRLLLYATTGGTWAHPERVTFSFAPDGTSIGGTPSALFQTLNAKFATSTWQDQFRKAAAVWEAVANINLVQVPDNGAPIGGPGNQQGDPNFGDIRIGGMSQGSGQLGLAFLPPPANGGTDAGDFFLNTDQPWQIGSNYDIESVAIHEFGHALGMAHSAITSADMYAYYNAVKQTLTSDDVAGIQSIYGARQPGALETSPPNNISSRAIDVTPMIGAHSQIVIPGLSITDASTDPDWFKVTVPATTTGKMTVTMQSTGLSELSPRIQVYNASVASLAYQAASNAFGATVSVTLGGVVAGQVYYIKASAANAGPTGEGAYGLLVNFGATPLPTIAPPNTVVAGQPDQGGGSIGDMVHVGKLRGHGDLFTAAGPSDAAGVDDSVAGEVAPSEAAGYIAPAVAGIAASDDGTPVRHKSGR